MPTFDIPAEIALVKAILAHPAGYDLDFGGILCIRPTGGPFNDQETWEVEWQPNPGAPKSPIEVKSFPKEQLDEATTFYVQKRHELGWGLDFEIDDWEKLKASKGHQG